jgi:hypothetical protein
MNKITDIALSVVVFMLGVTLAASCVALIYIMFKVMI